MKITTDYWAKPIPIREYDWSAVLDGYDAGDPIGYGPTEEAARNDLLEQIAEQVNLHDLMELSETESHRLAEQVTFWCGKFGVHYCFECGNAYDDSYGDLSKECPDHMKCGHCRYGF